MSKQPTVKVNVTADKFSGSANEKYGSETDRCRCK